MNKLKLIGIFAKNRLFSGRKPLLTRVRRLLLAAVLLLPAFAARADVVFTNLYSFVEGGETPNAELVQGNDGYLYGTTSSGGPNASGTIFKTSTNGALTTLYSFSGPDGSGPSGLVLGSDGYLYGTTSNGGTDNAGTVFKITTNGALTTLYYFSPNIGFRGKRYNPMPSGLVQSTDGYLYGTTENGGTNGGSGTVFKITPNGTLTSLYSFGSVRNTYGVSLDGSGPGRLVQGTDGYFYGTTSSGGTYLDFGTVFKIGINGALTSLYSFGSVRDTYGVSLDGSSPGRLVQGSDSYLYGTTGNGGTKNAGTVFKISTNGTLTNLYSFTGKDDGYGPGELVRGSDGYYYGTTVYGGNTNLDYGAGYGTIFKISTNGTFTSLYAFGSIQGANGNPLDGSIPSSGLMQGNDGYFYSTTGYGGTYNSGTLFKISTDGVLTTIYSFTGGNYGLGASGLSQGRNGSFYGTTWQGGTNGAGTVFRISTSGELTSLYSFGAVQSANGSPLDGSNPSAGLVQGSDGYFYGTTSSGGTNNAGTIFKISTNGVLTTMYSCPGGYDVESPNELVQGSDGFFYGTMQTGGDSLVVGSVFKIGTNGVLTTLYYFNFDNDGGYPQGPLVRGSDGFFYGTTSSGGTNLAGTVFRVSANGALIVLYSFGSVQDTNGLVLDGSSPTAGLVQGRDGYFYGTTRQGGMNGAGTIFKINSFGTLTTLYSFPGGTDGGNPETALVQGSDGSLYGTTAEIVNGGGPLPVSGVLSYGTIFKMSLNGEFNTLKSFSGPDGAGPSAALVRGINGNFYGTTSSGGAGFGTIFRLTIVPEFQALTLTHGTLNLTWNTEAGGIYQLQSSVRLDTPNWTNLGSPVTATNGTLTFTDAVTNAPQRFYRVSLAP